MKEDLSIEENMRVFHDSLFCIHLQRQYSAARELDEFLSTNKIDPKNILDPNIAKYYQALKVSLNYIFEVIILLTIGTYQQ
ncbi:hypothetical protein EON65_41960 [archaeon]|nr:MAG: hypothetical protein EON65_41960 [archaeon]